jgi:F0F1-type ATP synthase assembly protein I
VQEYWKNLGGPGTVGLEVVLSIAVGLLGGHWLDGKLGTGPWLALIGLAYGLAAGGRAIYRALRKANRELEELEKKERTARKDYDDDDDGPRGKP